MSIRLFAAATLALLLAACSGHESRSAPAAPVSTPLAVAVQTSRNYAADGLDATAWVQTSIAHDAIFVQTYRDAREHLAQALADPTWNALIPAERVTAAADLPPAVILDIDETVLDNSPYQARLIRSGTAYDDATWADWVREEAARALPGALEFTRYADAQGVRVIYISNRDQTLDEATLANLRALGFPVSGPQAFLGLGTVVAGCTQVGSDKTCRRQQVARAYRVVMQIGDQIGDFLPIPDNSLAARRQATAPYMAWFGERWFMLPNPTYGSWEPALFDNDWSRSPDERHQDKIDALRTQ